MNDSAMMGLVEGTSDFNPDLDRLLDGQRTFAQPIRRGPAFQKLHDEVIDAVLVTDIVETRLGQISRSARAAILGKVCAAFGFAD